MFFFRRAALDAELRHTLSAASMTAYAMYLLLGSIRGFTLIPSTTLVLAAIAFLPPAPLLGLTLLGILISSASIYYFAEALRLADLFERRHARQVARVKGVLQRHELPIIVGWSFFPLAPTDVIVYVCGALRVNVWKCLAGVMIGEGAICALYIFGGDALLRMLHFKT